MLGLAELGTPRAGVDRRAGHVNSFQMVLGVSIGLVDLAAEKAGECGGPLLADVQLAGRLEIGRSITYNRQKRSSALH